MKSSVKLDKLVVEYRPLRDIRPYERDQRKNDPAVEAVMTSIREFGFRQPIVVDPDGTIIVGHTRYLAATKLGLETVPVPGRGLSAEQVKAYHRG